MITRSDVNQTFNADGTVAESTIVQVDVTADVVAFDLHTKARAALVANTAYLAIATPTNAQVVAQVQRLTRECSAIIKLLLEDLADTTGT